MSSFSSLESSAESSRPVEIYRFALGSEEFLYTSSANDIVRSGETFVSVPIKRDRIVVGQSERKRVVSIDLPSDNEFAQLYVGTPPGQKATVVISRLQRDESPTFATKIDRFYGVVASVNWPNAATARIAARTDESAVENNLPKYTYMGMCNHTLYGPGCDVDPIPHTFAGTISVVSGRDITVPGAGASGKDFTGGFVRLSGSGGDPRIVLKQAGDVLTLLTPFFSAVVGASVDCLAGCDHVIESDCALVFNNVVKNGSCRFVPPRNIFQQGLLPS